MQARVKSVMYDHSPEHIGNLSYLILSYLKIKEIAKSNQQHNELHTATVRISPRFRYQAG